MEKLAATDRREQFTHNARLWYTFTGMANKKNKKRQKKYRWIFIILICTAIVILAASYYAAPEKTSAFIYSITGIELTSLKEKNPFVLPDTARESPVPHSAPADAGIEILLRVLLAVHLFRILVQLLAHIPSRRCDTIEIDIGYIRIIRRQ